MTILNKKEQDILHDKMERGQELTSEEVQDLQETFDKEQGFGQPKYQEVIDEYGNIDWEYID